MLALKIPMFTTRSIVLFRYGRYAGNNMHNRSGNADTDSNNINDTDIDNSNGNADNTDNSNNNDIKL